MCIRDRRQLFRSSSGIRDRHSERQPAAGIASEPFWQRIRTASSHDRNAGTLEYGKTRRRVQCGAACRADVANDISERFRPGTAESVFAFRPAKPVADLGLEQSEY